MKRYLGSRHDDRVTVLVETDGIAAPLNPRTDIHNHSPTGFEWGYAGSGPAQLALAILADHLATHPNEILAAACAFSFEDDEPDPRRFSLADRVAHRLHQLFKWEVVGRLERDHFELTETAVSTVVRGLLAVGHRVKGSAPE